MDEEWRNELVTKGAAVDAIMERDQYAEPMECAEAIKALPSAQPEDIARDIATIIENEKDMRVILDHQWIPCSERLPDDYATVLITHRGGVSFGWYNGRYWERGASAKHRPLQTVIAWMPLPEAYKGEKNDKTV